MRLLLKRSFFDKMAGRKRVCDADKEMNLEEESGNKRAKSPDLEESGMPKDITVLDPCFTSPEKENPARRINVGEIWACFDAKDKMPRTYAQVLNYIDKGHEQVMVEVTRLKPFPVYSGDKEWIAAGFPATCGIFQQGDTSVESPDNFSHRIICKRQRPCVILEYFHVRVKLGQSTNIGTSRNGYKAKENARLWRFFQLLFFMGATSPCFRIRVGYLDRITGFVNLFKRRSKKNGAEDEDTSFELPETSLYRFSHKVPNVKRTCIDGGGIPDFIFELHPKCFPKSGFQQEKLVLLK
ncbi:OLC1v1026271C1 [Oldenlandia corymbosa var. corymbosa]|uniref:OLC1v1026271C1 n=1 Tax=Oldenlandia corymbosa var. corymbosa TaxID=529605 RepID=A0AAV1CA18_OLDCO|nr:OLC1v1026271C1 [Oldenlandia corymbosa var. corymbosa]